MWIQLWIVGGWEVQIISSRIFSTIFAIKIQQKCKFDYIIYKISYNCKIQIKPKWMYERHTLKHSSCFQLSSDNVDPTLDSGRMGGFSRHMPKNTLKAPADKQLPGTDPGD